MNDYQFNVSFKILGDAFVLRSMITQTRSIVAITPINWPIYIPCHLVFSFKFDPCKNDL